MTLIRKNFYITADQERELEALGELTSSEHIRRAIDEYLERKKQLPSASQSTKGGQNG